MPQASTPQAALSAVLEHIGKEQDRYVSDLQEFVRIPSVSADPKHKEDVRAAAEWLMGRLEQAGMENVTLVETSGHPGIVADHLHAGPDAPTLLVYGHYDTQPAEKSDGWVHEPFEGALEGGRIWGRGSTDDKGQLICHINAAEAWLKSGGGLPINLKMVFEGEEEVGSFHFAEILDKTGDRLRADLLIVSDSPMRGEDKPAITYSLRGLSYFFVDVDGPGSDLHSGIFGGTVWNPAEALAHMLATCKDPKSGKVLIDGFYDDVVEPTAEERERLKEVSDPDAVFLKNTGASALFGEEGWTPTERTGLRPTFEVNGIRAGYIGEGSKTVIPRTAHAKVSCRLVADQDPHRVKELVATHLKKVAPEGVRVSVELHNLGHPVRADPDHPMFVAVEKALVDTFDNRPALLPEGGSIPAVADMQKRLGVVPILVGFGHKDENMHAPEESFRLKNLFRGTEAAARIYGEIAAQKRG
ncbi:MAG: dipeptidase [Euryarchaeota archaeon]|nr:dipeptidase [Euryarchaeota archaeon]